MTDAATAPPRPAYNGSTLTTASPNHARPPEPPQETLRKTQVLWDAEQFDEASALLLWALEHHPDHVGLLRAAARTRLRMTDTPMALELLQRAHRLEPDNPHILGELGQAAQAAGQVDRATEHYQRALAMAPDDVAALCGLAQVHERMHRLDQAAQLLDRVAVLDPGNPWVRFYRASVRYRQGDAAGAAAALESLIADSPPAAVACDAWYKLAEICDRHGTAEETMACLAAAKGTMAPRHAALHERHQAYFAEVESSRAGVTAATLKRWAGGLTPRDRSSTPPNPASAPAQSPAASGRRLAFLVGFPRSGTTMLEQVLGAHPDVVAVDEREMLSGIRAGARDLADPSIPMGHVLDALTPRHLDRLRELYYQELVRILEFDPGDKLVIDKQPLNLLILPEVARIFPDATVIVALRDPRDVILSCYMQPWTPNRFTVGLSTLVDAARLYARVMSFWVEWREICRNRWIEVRYEDTVDDLESQARRVLAALGLPWNDSVLSFHRSAAEKYVRTPSYTGVVQPVHRKAVARWKKYESHFAPAMPVIEPLLKSFGYS